MAKFKPGKIGTVRILLLEDDVIFAGLVELKLAQVEWGEVVLEHVETLAGALAALERANFDLIISDLNLPDSGGLDTVQALVRATDRLIIVLTGDSEPLLREAAIARGAYDLLSKDRVDRVELGRLVRLALMQANTFRSLQDSETRFRSLTELSADTFWEQDEQYRFTSFAGHDNSKLPPGRAEAILGKQRWDTEYFNMTEADWAAHKATLEARQPFRDLELGRLGPGGEKIWMSISGEPVFDASGAFRGYRGVGKNITQRVHAEEGMRRFRVAMDHSADIVLLVDRATMRYVDANDTVCRLLGYSREELLAMGPSDLLPISRQELEKQFDAMIANPEVLAGLNTVYRRKDGSLMPFESTRRVTRTDGGWILIVVSRDLTERRRAEERQAVHLRYQQELARFGASALDRRDAAELAEDAVQGVFRALGADIVAYIERDAVSGLVVRSASGLEQRHTSAPASFSAQDAVAQVLERGEPALLDGAARALPFDWARPYPCTAIVPVQGEERVQGLLCALSRNAGALGAGECEFLATAANVLSAGLRRIASESQLAFLAQFDVLTGLPNRGLLADRFQRMIAQARRNEKLVGVLFADLDGFKLVNDTVGHAGGDELLKEVGRRLQESVRAADTVARISGDEFAVLLGDLARPEDAALVAQKIIERIAAPIAVQRQEVFVTASIGIAVFPADGDNAETLLGAADAAMYRAKQSGRNSHQFYTADLNRRTRARAQLGLELRRALERGEFALAYQPKFDLRSGEARGAEALLRWRHPERGVVSPAEFIPSLEETGLIVQVGEWVLQRACSDLKRWREAGLVALPVAVNLSARQFRQVDLDARILDLVRREQVPPALIELEITESQVMQDPDHAKRVIQALSEGGIGVAIDDFGTGYSSLSYLTRFRVGALKIDRSFVADVLSDRAAAAIVGTIVDMAHRLGFMVVAEGVETEAQARLLRDLGCEQAQGYYFAKPMPEADFRKWLAALPQAAGRKAGSP
jgi:diguanylate cyclase (GGDEF)-like protein/PAS domain S-box-containing protein